jgi:hypothetical protein
MAVNYEKIKYPFEREPNEGVIRKVFFIIIYMVY